jgi:leucine-rich repeat/death domain-containing protein
VGLLVQALEQSDRQDVAEEVHAILELGRHKYQDSIRRTGLAPEDPALPGTSSSQISEPAQA